MKSIRSSATTMTTAVLSTMVAITVVATISTRRRLDAARAKRELGAHTLEYAVIAGVVAVLAIALGVKLTGAINSHSAGIR